MINLFEYKNKEFFKEEHFEDLEMFLNSIWNKREKIQYYTEEENREELQRFLQLFHKTSEIKSNKFVGVIHFKDETINLLPKIFNNTTISNDDLLVINSHIIWWLSYCRKLKFPNYISGLNNEKADFFEILIYLFSKYTKELLSSSIYQKYNEVEAELNNIKGRISFTSYINENLSKGKFHKVNCIYDSFEIDNDFNQSIKYVSKILLTASKDHQNKRNLRDILFLLDEVSDVQISSEKCKRLQFNPMFSSFETVRDYCVLFLENSISFNYKSDLKLFAFLLPMEYVFEDFIYGFIEKEIEVVNPKGQSTGTYLDEAQNFGLKPDLILDFGYKRIIADTKYKLVYDDNLDPKKGISQSDLYQMLAYAVRFGIQEIKLFYPNTAATDLQPEIATIEIKDTLANEKKINITAYQLPIIDKSITNKTLKDHDKLLNCFEGLRKVLKRRFEEIFTL